jgi:hypothetical protein
MLHRTSKRRLQHSFKICLKETVLIALASFGLYEQSSVVGICEHGSCVAFQEMSAFQGMFTRSHGINFMRV